MSDTCISNRSPVYSSLVDKLRGVIASGQTGTDQPIATEIELMRSSNLSRVSVRRAVDQLIAEGLLERRPGKGLFKRNPHTLTRTIQVIVPNMTLEQNAKIAWGVQQAGIQKGVLIQVYDARASMDQDIEVIRRLPDNHVDGAVIMSCSHPRFAAALYELESRGFPFVLVDEPLQDLRVATVTSDNYGGGYLVGKELARVGHRRIGFIGNLGAFTVRNRLDGMRDALSDSGVIFDRTLVRDLDITDPLSDWSEHIRKATKDIIERPDRATAVFCSCDQVAAWVYQAVKNAGLKIPDDVSIIGFDDISLCSMLDPPLSSVSQPLEQMGQTALEILMGQMSESRLTTDRNVDIRTLPTSLCVRGSISQRA